MKLHSFVKVSTLSLLLGLSNHAFAQTYTTPDSAPGYVASTTTRTAALRSPSADLLPWRGAHAAVPPSRQ